MTTYLFQNVQGAYAGALNEQEDAFFSTQTGSYLKYTFPGKKPEDAIKLAIDTVVTKHKDQITCFDFNNKEQEINKIYDQIESLMQNEINRNATDYVFYHGHSNAISLYIDVLHDFMEIANIQDLRSNHPLRLKKENQGTQDVSEFLNHFTDEYKKHAAYNNSAPYDPKRRSGFTSAPDLIDYARNHLMCVNLSLFGNTENAFESTFFYFVNSFNIGNPNDTLVENLLKSTGLAAQNPATLQNQIDAYKNIFMQKMQQAGGGLMQVFMKKDVVDTYGYACWAKGVPYYMTKAHAQFAVRNNHNLKALPILSDQTKALYRPKLSEMLDLYKKDGLKRFCKIIFSRR